MIPTPPPLAAPASPTPTAPPRWPTQTAYQDALQNPAFAFADPVLRGCVCVDETPFGLPAPISGQFANVYRMRDTDGRLWGVKLFLRPLYARAAHYIALRTHLTRLPLAPTWLVPFAFHENGICVEGGTFPVLQMPWLGDATPLNSYASESINDPAAIVRLREAWRRLIAAMDSEQFAHGDLQHGNIFVRGGKVGEPLSLHLLDYDSAYVPALAGRIGTETGHPAYQHPARAPYHYGPQNDRFAAVSIYAALVILSYAPELWYRYDNGENMLFRREDFSETRAVGRALWELGRHPNGCVRRVAAAMREVCEAPAGLVPDLEQFAASLSPLLR